jgi:hypothetical protein
MLEIKRGERVFNAARYRDTARNKSRFGDVNSHFRFPVSRGDTRTRLLITVYELGVNRRSG